MSYNRIPLDIKAYSQWINWKYEYIVNDKGERKLTKIPVRPLDQRNASVSNPLDWTDFDTAVNAATSRGYGIGFVFTKSDPFCGIDLDNPEGNIKVSERHRQILESLSSYTERSPSGLGLHIIVKAMLNGDGKRRDKVECYDSGRYFTFTGNVHKDAPITDCQDTIVGIYESLGPTDNRVEAIEAEPEAFADDVLIEHASIAKNGDKFKRLYRGDWKSDYGNKSQSEADFALINIIALYSRNSDQITRIFRQSGLGQRDKAKRGQYVVNMVKRASDRREPRAALTTEAGVPWFNAHNVEPWNPPLPAWALSGPMPAATPMQPPLAQPHGDVRLVQASTLNAKPIEWLWPGYLARGKLHVLAGQPGTGKTTLMLSLVASISVGGLLPDGTRTKACKALIWSSEDDLEDTLVPRLQAAGANMENVYFITQYKERPFNPATDMIELSKTMEQLTDVGLLMIDPIISAVAGSGNDNGDVRKGLQPLVDLGLKFRVAIVGISHFTKGTAGRDPTERIAGSLAFGALARMVFIAAKRQEEADGGSHMFARSKSNIAPSKGGFAYDLVQKHSSAVGVEASFIQWGVSLEGTAKEMLADAEKVDKEETDSSRINVACHFLKTVLRDGPVTSEEVKRQAKEQRISDGALKEAKELVGVKSEKLGLGAWRMFIPAQPLPVGQLQTPEPMYQDSFSTLS